MDLKQKITTKEVQEETVDQLEEVRLEDFLQEVGFGEVKMKVVDKKLFLVPKQFVERPGKWGMRVTIHIPQPIRLTQP